MTGQNTRLKGTEISHWVSLYAKNSSFILPTRDDATKTADLVLTHLEKFSFQMCIGTVDKKLKKEVLHILKVVNISSMADTVLITLSNRTQITFNLSITYLELIISSSLSDKDNILNRISKTTKVFGSLRALIFGNPYLCWIK